MFTTDQRLKSIPPQYYTCTCYIISIAIWVHYTLSDCLYLK